MCNRLPEINKNGDAGIFPVYYSLKSLGKARLKQTRTMKQFLEYSKGNNATLPVFIVANYFLAANKMCLVLSPTDNLYPYFHYLQH